MIAELRDAARAQEFRVGQAAALCIQDWLAPAKAHQQVLQHAQASLAFARAQLAMAEGKPDRAAHDWRIVLRWYEDRFEDIQRLCARGRVCGGRGDLEHARAVVADARARVAEAERKPEIVVAELRKVVPAYQEDVDRLRQLVEKKAIAEEDVKNAERHLWEVCQRLEAAEKALRDKD